MTLPEPSFIDRDGAVIRDAIVARVEELLGQSLPPASTERILCEQLAYRETLARVAVQEACKQNLWAYASYPMIDYLAALVGEKRLPAKAAVTTFQATLPAPRSVVSVVPATFAVRSKDGKVVFTLDRDVTIAAGQLSGTSGGTCTTAGTAGNGYLAGDICDLVSRLDFDVTVSNIGETGGGTVSESTEAMRARVPLAVGKVSGAGPSSAYEAIARGVSTDIVDVKATSMAAGVVRVAVLAATGVPSEELLAQVSAAYDPETNIPENDTVIVFNAVPIDYEIVLSLTLYRPQYPRTTEQVIADVTSRVLAYTAERGKRLGARVVPNRVEAAAMSVDEVYDCIATGISYHESFDEEQFSNLTNLTVNVAGYTEETLT